MSAEPASEIPGVSPQELDQLRQSSTVRLIDVRPPFDYFGGRVPGSLNLPGAAIQGRVGQMPPTTRLVFICDDGRKSAEMAQVARSAGFSDVSVLAGGYDAWLDADLPVDTISEGIMPGPPPTQPATEK